MCVLYSWSSVYNQNNSDLEKWLFWISSFQWIGWTSLNFLSSKGWFEFVSDLFQQKWLTLSSAAHNNCKYPESLIATDSLLFNTKLNDCLENSRIKPRTCALLFQTNANDIISCPSYRLYKWLYCCSGYVECFIRCKWLFFLVESLQWFTSVFYAHILVNVTVFYLNQDWKS